MILGLFWAGTASAQAQLSPDDFLDRAVGKTLSFSQYETGELVGREHFLRRDLSVWATRSGRCTYGQIEVRGPLICFLYEDNPDPDNCWMPFLSKGQLLVMALSRDIQRVTQISDTPVQCQDAPMS